MNNTQKNMINKNIYLPLVKNEWTQFQKIFRKAIVGDRLASLHLCTNENKQLCITYNNRNLQLHYELTPVVFGNIDVSVSARQFLDITKLSHTLELSINKDKLDISNSYSVVSIPIIEDIHSPYVKKVNENNLIYSFNPKELSTIGKAFLKVTHNESPRNYGQVINLSCENNKVRICGTDGFRLHLHSRYLYQSQDFNINITRKIWAILCDMPSAMSLYSDDANIFICTNNLQITAKLPCIKYPKYLSILPVDGQNEITIDRKLLVSILKSIIPSLDKSLRVKLKKLSENLPDITVNAKFLLDALRSGKQSANFQWSDNKEEPIKVSVENDSFSLIVPVKE